MKPYLLPKPCGSKPAYLSGVRQALGSGDPPGLAPESKSHIQKKDSSRTPSALLKCSCCMTRPALSSEDYAVPTWRHDVFMPCH